LFIMLALEKANMQRTGLFEKCTPYF